MTKICCWKTSKKETINFYFLKNEFFFQQYIKDGCFPNKGIIRCSQMKSDLITRPMTIVLVPNTNIELLENSQIFGISENHKESSRQCLESIRHDISVFNFDHFLHFLQSPRNSKDFITLQIGGVCWNVHIQ